MTAKIIETKLYKLGFIYSHPEYYCDVFFNSSDRLEILYKLSNVNKFYGISYKDQKFKTFEDLNVYLREEKFKELL